jgi:hypothetical protein
MLCDSNTGKCMQVYVREVPEDDKAPSVAGVVTFRLLKLLKEHE